jgi:hypothetical protein
LARHAELRPYSGAFDTANRWDERQGLNWIVGLPNPAKSGDCADARVSDRVLDGCSSTEGLPAGTSLW